MKCLLSLDSLDHAITAALFDMAPLMPIATAAHVDWLASTFKLDASTAEVFIEVMGLVAGAVVALQILQTIAEEKVVRDAQISAPTRVRRFLFRFMVVIVVAVAVEPCLRLLKRASILSFCSLPQPSSRPWACC
jgi:hypothetical protein